MIPQQRWLGRSRLGRAFALALLGTVLTGTASAQKLEAVDVEGQPLAANANRLLEALQFLGAPLSAETTTALQTAMKARDARKIQEVLDPHVLVAVTLNPESRVKV